MSKDNLSVQAHRLTFEAIKEMVSTGATYSSYIVTTSERSFSLGLSCDLITSIKFDSKVNVKLYLLPSLRVVFKGKCSELIFDGLFGLPVCAFEDEALYIDVPRKTRTTLFCGVLSFHLREVVLEMNPEFSIRSRFCKN